VTTPQPWIIVPGDPVAKARPRISLNGHAHTPAKTRRWETRAAYIARAAWTGPPLEGPVRVVVEVVHKRPARLCRKRDPDARIINGSARQDLDNVVKAALDAIQGIAFRNDNQVHLITARQWYAARDEEPCVEILVEQVTG
jgi:Holliday junction resolvase RusA-like endonuclease